MLHFLRIDEALVAAAAAESSALTDVAPALRAWVRTLDRSAKDAWLARAIEEPDLALGSEMLRTFRQQVKEPRRPARSVAALLAAADSIRANKLRA